MVQLFLCCLSFVVLCSLNTKLYAASPFSSEKVMQFEVVLGDSAKAEALVMQYREDVSKLPPFWISAPADYDFGFFVCRQSHLLKNTYLVCNKNSGTYVQLNVIHCDVEWLLEVNGGSNAYGAAMALYYPGRRLSSASIDSDLGICKS